MWWREGRGYWIGIRRVEVIPVHAADAIAIPHGIIVQRRVHQLHDIRRDQGRELLQRDDKRYPDEAAPVGVPGVVDDGLVGGRADGGLLGVLLIITVPGYYQWRSW